MINPYKAVSWQTCQHIASCSHYHCLTDDYVAKAYEKGLRHFAVSNYYPSKPRYPLGDYFSVPADVISSPNAEHVKMSDGGNLHLSGLGSFWESGKSLDEDPNYVGVGNTWKFAVTNILANLQYPNGGGVVINHPNFVRGGAIPVKEIKKILDYRAEVLGVEIYNSDLALKEYPEVGWALDKWDEILKTGRRAWGFCVQDWDVDANVGRIGCNVLLINEFTEEKCLEAYRNGNFYGRLQISSDLRFTGIAYDGEAKTLTVATENADWVDVIYGLKGKIYRERRYITTECSFSIPAGATYARAEAGKNGENKHTTGSAFYGDCSDVIFSNPIMLTSTIEEYDRTKTNPLMWF